jgi:hypothetical protein
MEEAPLQASHPKTLCLASLNCLHSLKSATTVSKHFITHDCDLSSYEVNVISKAGIASLQKLTVREYIRVQNLS